MIMLNTSQGDSGYDLNESVKNEIYLTIQKDYPGLPCLAHEIGKRKKFHS